MVRLIGLRHVLLITNNLLVVNCLRFWRTSLLFLNKFTLISNTPGIWLLYCQLSVLSSDQKGNLYKYTCNHGPCGELTGLGFVLMTWSSAKQSLADSWRGQRNIYRLTDHFVFEGRRYRGNCQIKTDYCLTPLQAGEINQIKSCAVIGQDQGILLAVSCKRNFISYAIW